MSHSRTASDLRIQLEGRLEVLEQATQRLDAARRALELREPLPSVDVDGAEEAATALQAKLEVAHDEDGARALRAWGEVKAAFTREVQRQCVEHGLPGDATTVREAWSVAARHLPVLWTSQEHVDPRPDRATWNEVLFTSLAIVLTAYFKWPFVALLFVLALIGFVVLPLINRRTQRRTVHRFVLTQHMLIARGARGGRLALGGDTVVDFEEVPGAVWLTSKPEGREVAWKLTLEDGRALRSLMTERWPGPVKP